MIYSKIGCPDCVYISLKQQQTLGQSSKHRHLDNNRLLILPPHAAPFLALICLIFAAAGNITNAVNKADGMGQ